MANKLKEDFICDFRDYKEITVPKGTRTTNMTAMGYDSNYNFVDEFEWVEKQYPEISSILISDLKIYGLNIPKKHLENEPI